MGDEADDGPLGLSLQHSTNQDFVSSAGLEEDFMTSELQALICMRPDDGEWPNFTRVAARKVPSHFTPRIILHARGSERHSEA